MAFLLSRTTTTLVGTTLGLGLTFTLHPLSPFRAAPLQCQYSAPSAAAAGTPETNWTVPSSSDPTILKQGRTGPILTASNMRQVSLGSVLGLVVGVGLRAFSRVLVVLIGMGIVVVEWAAAKGYNILPVNTVQKYVKRVDLQGAVSKHIPFKLSFGLTMGLAAFAQF
ncbi:uncharacterized protein BO95DRAFT_513035 [Aspergillus brunneoviolaceus CBS 621.78]|uniref:Uncharacterized protein n=1 Tax=Aspergillus brunneoviolaceus CBS 621.78 TaxID=1450534 RepID=A0ACD1GEB9_9EURO|nr:hypothetical protein BO95DRAFT_513035 [Aspergillus brunneoviolaceus CBS 621.78]RAH47639.1 hypothetical protein BO95DRAFT_513035 [Aspergillus brunneoviolaceus CBS 621.78]